MSKSMSRLKKFLVVLGIIIGAIILLAVLLTVVASLKTATGEEKSSSRSYPAVEAPSYSGSAGLSSANISRDEYAPPEPAGGSAANYETAPAAASPISSQNTTVPEINPKVIKTGQLELEVKQVGETIDKITAYVKQKEGFVADSGVNTGDDGVKYATMVVRLPAKYFETALVDFKLMAQSIKQETAAGQDVTEEYVDLQSRLKNLRLEEKQYQAVLKTAKTTADILQVNKYLYGVRDEIEMIEGRMRYMDNLTDLSTITLFLSEEATVKIPTGAWHPFIIIKEALRATVIFWQKLATAAIWIFFLFVPLLLVIWAGHKIVKAIRARRKMRK